MLGINSSMVYNEQTLCPVCRCPKVAMKPYHFLMSPRVTISRRRAYKE